MSDELTPEEARVRAIFGDKVTVKAVNPVAHKDISDDSDAAVNDLITRLCYFYPQYTLETAELLTSAQVMALLYQAEKQRALDYYNLTLISAAPHTKKGSLVDKLIKQYKKIAEA